MKHDEKVRHNAVILVSMAVGMYFACQHAADDSSMRLSFDSPFPVSLYKNVLDGCMNLCGDCALLQSCSMQESERTVVTDLLIGRIVRLHTAVIDLINQHKKVASVPTEDGEYLMTLVDNLDRAYQQTLASAQYATAGHLLLDMQQRLKTTFIP